MALGPKKNWAFENLPFRNEWVFIVMQTKFCCSSEEEVRSITTNKQEEVTGYWINRRFMFMGKWLKHAYYLIGTSDCSATDSRI